MVVNAPTTPYYAALGESEIAPEFTRTSVQPLR